MFRRPTFLHLAAGGKWEDRMTTRPCAANARDVHGSMTLNPPTVHSIRRIVASLKSELPLNFGLQIAHGRGDEQCARAPDLEMGEKVWKIVLPVGVRYQYYVTRSSSTGAVHSTLSTHSIHASGTSFARILRNFQLRLRELLTGTRLVDFDAV